MNMYHFLIHGYSRCTYYIPDTKSMSPSFSDSADTKMQGPVKIRSCSDSGTADETRECSNAYDGGFDRQPRDAECYSSSTASNVFVNFDFEKQSRVKYIAMLARGLSQYTHIRFFCSMSPQPASKKR